MPVQIHGKDYYTVIERVNMLRSEESTKHFSLETEIVESNQECVIFKALIKDESGRVLATGHAEERRGATQINRTSALENCETSAIGRALASMGLGGTEFASANEVQNAIAQQDLMHGKMDTKPIDHDKVNQAAAFFKEHIDADQIEDSWQLMQKADKRLSNDERSAVAKILDSLGKAEGSRKKYTTLLKEYMEYTPINNPDTYREQ